MKIRSVQGDRVAMKTDDHGDDGSKKSTAALAVFIFGLGYTGSEIARHLLSQGCQVGGTVRGGENAHELRARGVEVVKFDSNDALDSAQLEAWRKTLLQYDYILSTLQTCEEGSPVLLRLCSVLKALDHLKWVGYLSTTAVYGDRGGAVVDEATPRAATSRRGKKRVLAEEQWEASGLPLHIFRLPGIYGPGRGPFAKLRNGVTNFRIVKEGQVFSRIHVQDIAQAVIASMRRPNPGAVYNIVDNEPATPQEVIEYACNLMGLEPPPMLRFDDPSAGDLLSPMVCMLHNFAHGKAVPSSCCS